MRFELIDRAKKTSLSNGYAECWVSVERVVRMGGPSFEPAATAGHGAADPCAVGLLLVKRHLWKPAHDPGIAGSEPGCGTPPDGVPRARQWPAGLAKAPFQKGDGQRACLADRTEPAGSGFQHRGAELEMVGRYFLHLDQGGLALHSHCDGSVLTPAAYEKRAA